MKALCSHMGRLRQDCLAQDTIEYALSVGVVALATVAAIPVLNTWLSEILTKLGSIVTSTVP